MSVPSRKIVNAPKPAPRPAAASTVVARAVQGIQRSSALRVSAPTDTAEVEAVSTARAVVQMRSPAAPARFARDDRLLRAIEPPARQPPAVSTATATEIGASSGAGSPLPDSVRGFMEPRFGADFSNVRVHTGERSARLNRQLNAQAFTVGNQVFFGRDRFQPDTSEGRELIAHELTHTIQQGATIQRSADVAPVTERAPESVQRLGISDALDYIADKAYYIPGFRMLTVIIGVNPVNMSKVERSAANVLRAVVEFMPGGKLITDALDNLGVFEKVGGWVEQQIRSLGMTGRMFKDALDKFLDSLGWRDIFRLGSVWDRAKRIFSEPVDRLIAFVKGLVVGILNFIRDAILRPLAKLAEGTAGYDLLKAVLGRDPITGDPYPRNADTLIGGFMKLIGQEEVWQNLKKANAVARAFAWFQGALSGLMAFVTSIPGLFISTLKSLEIADFVLGPRAFVKVGKVFAGLVGRFFSWAGAQVMSLLEIIFEVVAPAVMPYLRKAAGAFKTIIANPIGFIGNLIRAGKQGFLQFAKNFLTHLKASLIGWLTGTLASANIYIPQAFTLREIIKFVLSVLGLTWANVRAKLVKVIGEKPVQVLETGFDIVVTLVTEGPAAAWQKIQEAITNLREMVMDQIMTFVRDKIVEAAITKLLTSLNPAGAFIQAVIAIYNTVMFLVERLKQIAQVVAAFIDSIAAIASGAIAAAANRVEKTMGGLLTLVISFLARLVGLGKVSDVVVDIVNKIRAPIDKALDRVIDWIVATAKKLGKLVAEKAEELFSWAFAKRQFAAGGVTHHLYVSDADELTIASTPQGAEAFVDAYLKENSDPKGIGPRVKPLIKQAKAIAAEIAKVKGAKGAVPAKAKQKELLDLSLQICEMLTELVGGDRDIGDEPEKYLLEGQVGTYATVPKPVGDQLTPDHQPQASVILGAADFFRKQLKIKGGELADRAANRAAKGYAINLHFVRHVAGATYGSKGWKRDDFHKDLVANVPTDDIDKAKKGTVKRLKALLDHDVSEMKKVAGKPITDTVWTDLGKAIRNLEKRKKVRQEIVARINSGENQIASQPFDF